MKTKENKIRPETRRQNRNEVYSNATSIKHKDNETVRPGSKTSIPRAAQMSAPASAVSHRPSLKTRLNRPVFFSSAILIIAFTAIIIAFPQASTAWLSSAQATLASSFGWYYMLVVAAYLGFIVWLAASPYGKIKLGADDEQPAFSYGAWAGMLFSSGIGISLLYFGASEPLTHYLYPPQGAAATPAAASQAMTLTFLHWGLHGWAIYALIAVALGYFAYRHKQPLALRTALYPLLGERVHGAAGHAVDCFGIVVTVLGLVSNLGIGSLQISAGLEHLFGLQNSHGTLLAVIIVMTMVATLAAISGVETGIRRLSNLNVVLFASLLVFVLSMGPTLHLLNAMIQNLGDYASNFVGKTFDLYAYGRPSDWLGKWTLFYWAWWISWAPFVGLFIARISRGRTIREVVTGVLLLPLAFTLVWLSVFGNSALDLLISHGAAELSRAALEQPAMTMYKLLAHYPFGTAMSDVAIFVGFVLFLTPADSGAVMLANLSVRGAGAGDDADAPHWLRIFWSALIMAVTVGLMFADNISAIQTTIVLASLPFSVVLVLYMVCLMKSLRLEFKPAAAAKATAKVAKQAW